MSLTKRCIGWGDHLSHTAEISEFGIQNGSKDGLQSLCKAGMKIRNNSGHNTENNDDTNAISHAIAQAAGISSVHVWANKNKYSTLDLRLAACIAAMDKEGPAGVKNWQQYFTKDARNAEFKKQFELSWPDYSALDALKMVCAKVSADRKKAPKPPQIVVEPATIIDIEDLAPYSYRPGRFGLQFLSGGGKKKRKGCAPYTVAEKHIEDQNILVQVFAGAKAVLEEDFIDLLTESPWPKIREYKPNVTSTDVDAALGKLHRAKQAYIRKHGVVPDIGFITRRRLSAEVVADFKALGATVERLTKDNQVLSA